MGAESLSVLLVEFMIVVFVNKALKIEKIWGHPVYLRT
jgi:hypothetical protein